MPDEDKITLGVIGENSYFVIREGTVVTLFITRETTAKNMLWVRKLSVGIRWPPVLWVNCFTEVQK